MGLASANLMQLAPKPAALCEITHNMATELLKVTEDHQLWYQSKEHMRRYVSE